MASNLDAMASNLIEMASNPIAMASNPLAMASNLIEIRAKSAHPFEYPASLPIPEKDHVCTCIACDTHDCGCMH